MQIVQYSELISNYSSKLALQARTECSADREFVDFARDIRTVSYMKSFRRKKIIE